MVRSADFSMVGGVRSIGSWDARLVLFQMDGEEEEVEFCATLSAGELLLLVVVFGRGGDGAAAFSLLHSALLWVFLTAGIGGQGVSGWPSKIDPNGICDQRSRPSKCSTWEW